jgi:hypothetical protein
VLLLQHTPVHCKALCVALLHWLLVRLLLLLLLLLHTSPIIMGLECPRVPLQNMS